MWGPRSRPKMVRDSGLSALAAARSARPAPPTGRGDPLGLPSAAGHAVGSGPLIGQRSAPGPPRPAWTSRGRSVGSCAGDRSGSWVRADPQRPRPGTTPRPAWGTGLTHQPASARGRPGRAESAVAWGGFLCARYASGGCGVGWGLRSDRGGTAARPGQAFRHSGERGGTPPGHACDGVTPPWGHRVHPGHHRHHVHDVRQAC